MVIFVVLIEYNINFLKPISRHFNTFIQMRTWAMWMWMFGKDDR